MKRILLARIGWMKFYTGSQPGDKKPIGGGKWTVTHVGAELNNFKRRAGKVYGFVQRAMKATELNLARIDPKAIGHSLDKVLVIFFAPHPDGKGQVVVGWHRNSKVFSQYRKSPWWHCSVLQVKDAVLLPTNRRTCVVPRGKNAPGQANVFFLYDSSNRYRKSPWVDKVLDFIGSYSGPNLVATPEAEAQTEIEDAFEKVQATAFAQGVQPDPAARRAVENAAMRSARRYFEGKGYDVSNVSSTQSYDFCCRKNGRELFVEVKGSHAPVSKILLTRNEVAFAKRNSHKMALYLLHSIRVTKKRRKFQALGGQRKVISPWRIQKYELKPTHYFCRLSK